MKTLRSAVANASHNANLKAEDLYIKTILVNQGVALKRIRPAAMGAAHGYKKHAAHLEITIAVKPAKVEKKAATAKVTAPAKEITAETKKTTKAAKTAVATKKPAAKKTK